MAESLLRLHYSAADAAAATTAARAVFGAAEVSMRGRSLVWRQTSIVDDGISVTRIEAAGDGVQLRLTGASELIVVRARRGHVVVHADEHRAELPRDGLALIPIGAQARVELRDAALEVVSFPPAPVARLLGVAKRAVQLHAPRITPRSDELATYFRQVTRLLTAGVFGVPEVYDRDLVRTHTINVLTAVTVEAFELTNRSEDSTERDMTVLRRALAVLREHLADPISIPDVAEASGVSVRGLQIVFQRQLGISPLLHLRTLRLEAARTALLDTGSSGTTIADVARRFGYSNSGRFSTHYRDAYGESPAASLRRVRSGAQAEPATTSEAKVVQPGRVG